MNGHHLPQYKVVYSVKSDNWITVTNILRFLDCDDPNQVRFVWASEESGWRHLYLVKTAIGDIPTDMDGERCFGISP